jgi:hypothetical protein
MSRAASIASIAAAASVNGARAADRAVSDAVALLDGPASLVLAFPSGLHPELAAKGLGGATGGAPVVGMTGNGSIGAGAAIERGCSALAFGATVAAGIGVARDAKSDLRGAASTAAVEALARIAGAEGHRLLILMLDTRCGDQAEAIAGAYEVAGPDIPIAGGAAGGSQPAQLIGAEATRECVLAVALASPGPIGIGSAHGCRIRAVPSIVTSSTGRYVDEIDGRPAVAVYLEKLGYGDLELSDDQFEALAVTHPIAQPELQGHTRIRHVLGRRGASLHMATHIPSNAAIEFTHETPEEIVAASRESVRLAVEGIGGAAPRAALIFDCAGRKRAVAGSLSHEVSALLDAFPDPAPPLAGLFTHGEIARSRGAKGDLNHAVVTVAFA